MAHALRMQKPEPRRHLPHPFQGGRGLDLILVRAVPYRVQHVVERAVLAVFHHDEELRGVAERLGLLGNPCSGAQLREESSVRSTEEAGRW